MPFLSLTVHCLCRGCSFHRNEDIWESLETECVRVRKRRGTGKELGCDSLSLGWKYVFMIVEVTYAEWMNERRDSGRRIFSSHFSLQGSEDTERYSGTVLKALLSLNRLKQTVNGEQKMWAMCWNAFHAVNWLVQELYSLIFLVFGIPVENLYWQIEGIDVFISACHF